MIVQIYKMQLKIMKKEKEKQTSKRQREKKKSEEKRLSKLQQYYYFTTLLFVDADSTQTHSNGISIIIYKDGWKMFWRYSLKSKLTR